jgi:UDP-N-acetylglucosamine acyltransferase
MNEIHPTAIIGPGVDLGDGNIIGPYAVILGPCVIGDDNWIGPFVAIGQPPEHRDAPHRSWAAEPAGPGVTIGDRNVLHEFVVIQQGMDRATSLGNGCFLMDKSHLAHDCALGDGVTFACSVMLAGNVTIGAGANLGLNAVVHQGRSVGTGAMVGMAAVITKDVPPFAIAYGSPARVNGINTVGLERAPMPPAMIEHIASVFESAAPEQISGLLSEEIAYYRSVRSD